MFALMAAPMLFFLSFLMAREKTAGLGSMAALYFANVGAFQDRMAYDPIGFVNVSIAFTFALAAGGVLFALIAPDTAPAARRRFARVARRALERISRRRHPIALATFETVAVDALHQLRRALLPGESAAAIEAGVALLGCGRELIRVRDGGRPTSDKRAVAAAVVRALGDRTARAVDSARRAVRAAIATCVHDLRDDRLSVADARAAAREMVAYAAIRDALEQDRPVAAAPSPRSLAHAA
jgi:uncharacterized membrane protein YccC